MTSYLTLNNLNTCDRGCKAKYDGIYNPFPHYHCPVEGCDFIYETDYDMEYGGESFTPHVHCRLCTNTWPHFHCEYEGCRRGDLHKHCNFNDCQRTDVHVHCQVCEEFPEKREPVFAPYRNDKSDTLEHTHCSFKYSDGSVCHEYLIKNHHVFSGGGHRHCEKCEVISRDLPMRGHSYCKKCDQCYDQYHVWCQHCNTCIGSSHKFCRICVKCFDNPHYHCEHQYSDGTLCQKLQTDKQCRHCRRDGCNLRYKHYHCSEPGCNWVNESGPFQYHRHCSKAGCPRTDEHVHSEPKEMLPD